MRERLLLWLWLLIPGAGCGPGDKRDTTADANEVTASDAGADAVDVVDAASDVPDETATTAPGGSDATGAVETTVADTPTDTIADMGPDPYGDTPILQRPLAAGAVTCTAARVAGFALPGYFASFELARGPAGAPFEHYVMSVFRASEPVYTVQLAPLDAAGALMPPIYSNELGQVSLSAFAATGTGDGFAMAWHLVRDNPNPPFTLARVGADGARQDGPNELTGTDGYIDAVALESRADGGLTALWRAYDEAWRAVFRMARFTSDGTPVGEVATLVSGDPGEPEDNGMAYAMRAADAGVVVAWARGKDSQGWLRVAAFDAAGAPLGAPLVVASAAGGIRMPALVRHGDGFLLAWVEGPAIRVLRLDAELRSVGASVALGPSIDAPDKPVAGQPVWLAAGARAVLAWAKPDHYPGVGGGVYPLGWVLLDPATLAPASNLLSFEDAMFRDGIRDGAITHVRMTADGLDFRAYYKILYHAGNSAGASHITCVSAP